MSYTQQELQTLWDKAGQKQNYSQQELQTLWDNAKQTNSLTSNEQNFANQGLAIDGRPIPQAPDITNTQPEPQRAKAIDYIKSLVPVPYVFKDSQDKVYNDVTAGAKTLAREILGRDSIDTVDTAFQLHKQVNALNRVFKKAETVEDVKANNLAFIDSMAEFGFDVRMHPQTMKLYYVDGRGNSKELEASMLKNFLNQLFSEKYSISAELGLGALGAKAVNSIKGGKAKNPLQVLAKPIIGFSAGAGGGAYLGSYIDTLSNALTLNQDFNFDNANKKATDNAIFATVAPLVLSGAGKIVGGTYNTIKDKVAKANIDGAENFLRRIGIEPQSGKAISDETAKYSNNQKIIGNNDLEQRQNALFAIANTDENVAKELGRALREDNRAGINYARNIDARAMGLINKAENLAITPEQIQRNILDYEKRVKGEYAQIKNALGEALPNKTWNIRDSDIISRVREYEELIGVPQYKEEIKALANRLDRRGNLNIGDLIEVREEINDILSRATKNSSRGSITQREANYIKSIVDDEIGRMINTLDNPQQVKKLWSKALEDYSKMKELQKETYYKNIIDGDATPDKVNTALKESSQSLGNKLSMFIEQLPKEQQAQTEMRVIANAIKQYTAGDVAGFKAIKFPELAKSFENVKLTTQEAKDFISTIDNMAKLFKFDNILLEATTKYTPKQLQQGMSYNPLIRARTMYANKFINSLSTYLGNDVEQKALMFHLKNASLRANTPKNFLDNLKSNNAISKELINELTPIVRRVEEIDKQIITQADTATARQQPTSEEFAQQVQRQAERDLAINDLTEQQLQQGLRQADSLASLNENELKQSLNKIGLALPPNKQTTTATTQAQQPNNPVQEYLNSRGIGKQSRLSPEDLKLEQDSIWKTTFGDQSVTQIRTRDLNDVINYEKGNDAYGAKHIIKRHFGNGKLGELTEEEFSLMGEIIRNGKIHRDLIKKHKDGTKSYAYELYRDGIRFRVAVKKEPKGKKIVTMYSNRKGDGTFLEPINKTERARQIAYFNSLSANDSIPQKPTNTQEYFDTLFNYPNAFKSVATLDTINPFVWWDIFKRFSKETKGATGDALSATLSATNEIMKQPSVIRQLFQRLTNQEPQDNQ